MACKLQWSSPNTLSPTKQIILWLTVMYLIRSTFTLIKALLYFISVSLLGSQKDFCTWTGYYFLRFFRSIPIPPFIQNNAIGWAMIFMLGAAESHTVSTMSIIANPNQLPIVRIRD